MPAVLLGPRQTGVSGGVELGLPRAAALEDLAIGSDPFVLGVVDAQLLGQVRVEPGADLVAERILFRSKFEIHLLNLLSPYQLGHRNKRVAMDTRQAHL